MEKGSKREYFDGKISSLIKTRKLLRNIDFGRKFFVLYFLSIAMAKDIDNSLGISYSMSDGGGKKISEKGSLKLLLIDIVECGMNPNIHFNRYSY